MSSKFSFARRWMGYLLPLLLVAVTLSSCNLPAGNTPPSPPSVDAQATQAALAVQATLVAGQVADMTAQAASNQAQNDAQATQAAIQTQIALAAQQTVQAQPPQSATEPPPTTPPTAPPTAAPTSAPAPTATSEPQESFDTWIKTANILLFEDMVGDYRTTRYIKAALDALGLRYTDVGDALGNYKDQLLSNGPGGQGWDLIISGKELRTAVSGEFYVYLNDALNQGSSVIIEEWDLDAIGAGKISTILARCGVEIQADWWDKPLNEQLLWAVEGSSPIFHYPNEGISLRNPSGYWRGDLGDLLRLAPGSQATPLWSARTNLRDSYLTAVACLDNRLILQTYSTHDYGKDRVVLMWQNYIYNTLQARYNLTHPPR